ncbi:24485_t:CDS:2, partial [Cetraspora pellucida]
ICNGIRPKTCNFVPQTYNDMLRKCWDQNPLERLTIAMKSTFNEYASKLKEYELRKQDLKLNQELLNSHNATITYNLMRWKQIFLFIGMQYTKVALLVLAMDI